MGWPVTSESKNLPGPSYLHMTSQLILSLAIVLDVGMYLLPSIQCLPLPASICHCLPVCLGTSRCRLRLGLALAVVPDPMKPPAAACKLLACFSCICRVRAASILDQPACSTTIHPSLRVRQDTRSETRDFRGKGRGERGEEQKGDGGWGLTEEFPFFAARSLLLSEYPAPSRIAMLRG